MVSAYSFAKASGNIREMVDFGNIVGRIIIYLTLFLRNRLCYIFSCYSYFLFIISSLFLGIINRFLSLHTLTVINWNYSTNKL